MRSAARSRNGPTAQRCLVLWFPAWEVTAWALSEGTDADRPVVVVAANRVVACSTQAAAEGVEIGQRRREAQSRCPELLVQGRDEARDAREFEAVVECVERLVPAIQVVRPGVCALRPSGFARYVGGEAEAAEVLLEAVVTGVGVTSGRVGIADGRFTALQAAHAGDPVRIVPPGGSAEFLAPLPVARLGDEVVASLLPRLGVHTLGAFVALGAQAARDRFGLHGQRLHALAAGADAIPVEPRLPPPELVRQIEFEPPLALVDQVAFTARAMAEEFIEALSREGLVCTELRIELSGELDELVSRSWAVPGVFDAPAVVDRIRWQLQAAAGGQLNSAVAGVRLEPLAVDAIANHAVGLFGSAKEERVHHVLSRVQAMLGHEGVLRPHIGEGRWLAERQVLIPWGDRPPPEAARQKGPKAPWPGHLLDPLPASVFASPHPVQLLSRTGDPVGLDDRGRLHGLPAQLHDGVRGRSVIDWAGPWPIDERTWDSLRHRKASRFQVIDEDGVAWLLVLSRGRWWAEGRYD